MLGALASRLVTEELLTSLPLIYRIDLMILHELAICDIAGFNLRLVGLIAFSGDVIRSSLCSSLWLLCLILRWRAEFDFF